MSGESDKHRPTKGRTTGKTPPYVTTKAISRMAAGHSMVPVVFSTAPGTPRIPPILTRAQDVLAIAEALAPGNRAAADLEHARLINAALAQAVTAAPPAHTPPAADTVEGARRTRERNRQRRRCRLEIRRREVLLDGNPVALDVTTERREVVLCFLRHLIPRRGRLDFKDPDRPGRGGPPRPRAGRRALGPDTR
jgi:hypothetical protein